MINRPSVFEENIPVDSITVERAGEILNKSAHSVRQLLMRGKIKKVVKGRRIFVDMGTLASYYAKKRKLPSYEESYNEVKEMSLIALDAAAQALMVQPPYVVRLIRNGVLKGYVTMSGDCLISRESINDYLRAPKNVADDL